MRILYHHRTLLEDAQGIHIGAMVRAFRDLGHEVEVVSLLQANGTRGPVHGASLSRLTQGVPDSLYEVMSLGYNMYGYRRLASAIARQRPDLIYERYALNTMCGIWASRRFAIPLLLEVNAPLYYEQDQLGKLRFKRLAYRTERWICSNSTRTIVVSGVLRDVLAQEGVPAAHMIVIPNGIDPQQFNPGISGAAVRRRYDLEGKVVVGVVGWFRKWHGVDLLVKTMHEGGLLDGQVRVLLVGDGPANAEVFRYAEAHRLLDSVVFTGAVAQSEVPQHIAAIDVAVQPSATDYACPMKIIEYMAMERCIVAPDQPNIRELLDDRATAFLFAKGNAASFRKVLEHATGDSDERMRVAHRAYERLLQQQLLWRVNAQRAVDLIGEHAH